LLFDVISTSYERTSVIVTTNLPFDRWTEVLGKERLVAATLDRLTHRCPLLEATGESYRLKEARRRRQATEKGGGREEKELKIPKSVECRCRCRHQQSSATLTPSAALLGRHGAALLGRHSHRR
jgi:hypothetical protein